MNLDRSQIKVHGGKILVHTNGYSEHLTVLEELFNELRRFNLKVAFKESEFREDALVYLGKYCFILFDW